MAGDFQVFDDDENDAISSIQKRYPDSWFDVGFKLMRKMNLENDYATIYNHHVAEGSSPEHACKRAIRDLQLEHDLSIVELLDPNPKLL